MKIFKSPVSRLRALETFFKEPSLVTRQRELSGTPCKKKIELSVKYTYCILTHKVCSQTMMWGQYFLGLVHLLQTLPNTLLFPIEMAKFILTGKEAIIIHLGTKCTTFQFSNCLPRKQVPSTRALQAKLGKYK